MHVPACFLLDHIRSGISCVWSQMFRHFWCLITYVPFFFLHDYMCSVTRRLSRGLVRHPRHHLLNNEPALGPWPVRHDFIDCTMKVSELFDWIIVALASVVLYDACKTHIYPVYFWVSFDDHEAITTLSCGRAALRGENGRSPRKALPGPRSSASTATPWSCSALGALHR